jgi:hypothetical protein
MAPRKLVLTTLVAVASLAPVFAKDRAPLDRVPLDMARGWQRRDWQRCQDPTRVSFGDGVIAFDSPRGSALVWQIPTDAGPAEYDRTLDWIHECDRPPLSFVRGVTEREAERLISLAEHPVLSWRWKVDRLADDSATLGPDGKIRREGDDFAAKLGVLIAEEGGSGAHEIAYVWTRSLPRETVLYQEARIALVYKVRSYRIVAESGEALLGQWTSEQRDVAADFERIFPGRRAGRVLRVHLMTDSDDTEGRTAAAYAEIAFLPRRGRV